MYSILHGTDIRSIIPRLPNVPILTLPTPIEPLLLEALDLAVLLSFIDFSRELTNLVKIYTDKNKYSRQDDNFDFKLIIFHDLYYRASVLEEAKVKAYPIMLSNLALNHYYTNLRNVA